MIVSLLPLEGGDGLLIPLLPPSSGRRWRVAPEVGFALFRLRPTPCHGKGGRWVTHPASPSFLWKEVARSAGGWLRSLSLSANPRPSGIPLPWEGGRWVAHPASPSFLWKEVARSAGGWLCSIFPSANPLPFGHPPSMGRGWMGYSSCFSLLPLEGGRSSAGGWLRSLRFQPTPCPSGIPLPWEGGRWITHP